MMGPLATYSRGWLGEAGTQPQAVYSRGWLALVVAPEIVEEPERVMGIDRRRLRRRREEQEIMAVVIAFCLESQ